MSSPQLWLFDPSHQSLNPVHEVRRMIRLAMSKSPLSREQIADEMNRIAGDEGMHKSITKATLDSWVKDSDPERIPSLSLLVIFCRVMGTVDPISVMAKPLGGQVINHEDMKLLTWARAEVAKKKAARRARLAMEAVELGE